MEALRAERQERVEGYGARILNGAELMRWGMLNTEVRMRELGWEDAT